MAFRLLPTFCLVFIQCVTAQCAAPEYVDKTESKRPATEMIGDWIDELDSDDFTARQRATRRLFESGRAAIEPLAAAARHGSLEAATRAIGILARLHEVLDADTRDEARRVLTQLSRSNNGSVARRAAAALESSAMARRHVDPAVMQAAHWHDHRREATQQIERAELEVRDTVQRMRLLAEEGLIPQRNTQLVERLRAAVQRLGQARMRLFQYSFTRSVEIRFDD